MAPGLQGRPRTLALGICLDVRLDVCLIVALFVWFGSGVEAWRMGQWGEIRERPTLLLVKPWNALRAFVSRDGDDRLYFQYAELMLGRPGDLAYIARKQQGDAQVALARLRPLVRQGVSWRLPYRDFPVEYPPLPLLLMLLPRLVADELPAYRVALTGVLGGLYLLACWLGARLAQVSGNFDRAQPVWRRMALLALATGPILCARFDLLPAVLVAASLLAVVQRRNLLGGLLFGLAFMAKLFPLLLMLPVLALLWGARERRRALVIGAAAAAGALAVALPFLLAAPTTFIRSVALYGMRPFQFESLGGSVLLALNGPATLIGSFGSHNVITPVWLGRLADVALWGGLLVLSVGAWRAGAIGRQTPENQPTQEQARTARALLRWVFAALLTILCFSKVLSPQFMIWLLPLAAVFGDDEGRRLFVATFVVIALTQIFYPALYGLAREGNAIAVGVLLARNVGLTVLAVLAVRAAWAPGGALSCRWPRTAARTSPH